MPYGSESLSALPMEETLLAFVVQQLEEFRQKEGARRKFKPVFHKVGGAELCLLGAVIDAPMPQIFAALGDPERMTTILTSPASPVVEYEGDGVYDMTFKVIGFKARQKVKIYLAGDGVQTACCQIQPLKEDVADRLNLLCFAAGSGGDAGILNVAQTDFGLPIPKFMMTKLLAKMLDQMKLRIDAAARASAGA